MQPVSKPAPFKINLNSKSGQAALEYMLLIAFIVIFVTIIVNYFLPNLEENIGLVGETMEVMLETGSKYK